MRARRADMPGQFQARVLLGILLVCLLLPPAHAEMLQFSGPDGVKTWPKLPDIPDWHQDQELSMKQNADILVPDGADPVRSEATIAAQGYPRSGDVSSVEQLAEKDRREALPGTQVTRRPDLYDKDTTPFMLMIFTPVDSQAGPWRAVAYSEEGEYLLAFSLNARTKAAFDKNLPVFDTLVQKYAKDIPW